MIGPKGAKKGENFGLGEVSVKQRRNRECRHLKRAEEVCYGEDSLARMGYTY